MGQVRAWGCLEVEADLAQTVAQRLRETSGNAVRFYGSIYYQLHAPVQRTHHDAIHTLQPGDLHLLDDADLRLRLDEPERALRDGIVVGAVIDGRLVARASCVARSRHYGDIGVATLEEFQGQGLATATAAHVAQQLQQAQTVPVWTTGETNWASQRVADKLGFTLTTRRTYVIPDTA
jgi:RimJ/RimL family protein N-acetyltransferase